MRTHPRHDAGAPRDAAAPWPFELTVEPIPRMLNCELADDPTYDGVELQWFDDALRGRGMLVFLSRRADRTVDYYPQRGLAVDPTGYELGAGSGAWTPTDFDAARLEIAADGVDAEARFTDVEGRPIEIRVDDRDGRRRRRARLLAPVSSSIDHPTALLVVWLHGFDLVRASGKAPLIRIAGRDARIGALPAGALHRRRLVKYAGPLCTVRLNPEHDGPLRTSGWDTPDHMRVEQGGHSALLTLDPAFSDLRTLPDTAERSGGWRIDVDGAAVTGGTWWVRRTGEAANLGLDVERPWQPGPLPPLMRVVTRALPVFRQWPTTYRWRASLSLGPDARMTSGWERTDTTGGRAYRRATGS